MKRILKKFLAGALTVSVMVLMLPSEILGIGAIKSYADCSNGHNYETVVINQTDSSYDEIFVCKECGYYDTNRKMHTDFAAHTHSFDLNETIIKEATTEETGLKRITCSLCGIQQDFVIDRIPAPEPETPEVIETPS